MLTESNNTLKVVIVDDSALFREAIKQAISSVSDVEVVKILRNGQEIVDYIKEGKPVDLITLDMEMPVLDGIHAISEIREIDKKVLIICFSALTQKGAQKTIDALTTGANDFVGKSNADSVREELLPKISLFRDKKLGRLKTQRKDISIEKDNTNKNRAVEKRSKSFDMPRAICIGSSTGGPEALKTVFSNLKPPFTVPYFIVQHMPPVFTTKLAETLDGLSELKVLEAKDKMEVQPGHCYLAPGDYHMTLEQHHKHLTIRLNQDPKVCFVRPSVDVFFNSAAEIYGERLLSVVLTGMGFDGRDGARNIQRRNGSVVIQDEDTSVVWGMPGAIAAENLQDKILNINEIGTFLNGVIKNKE